MYFFVFILLVHVCWCIYNRYYGSMSLRQFISYGHFHPFSCLNFSRLMKGLNNYNNVTEWDNWFICVAVETCEKKKFWFMFGPGYFSTLLFWRMVFFYWKSIDAPVFFFFFFFFRHFIFGKVWLLLFNTILNILIGFQCTCKYMNQWVWA